MQIAVGGLSYALNPGIRIGTIQRMEQEQTRVNTRRYSLGTHAFEPHDILPGQITHRLTLHKVMMYTEKSPFLALVNTVTGSISDAYRLGAANNDNDLNSLLNKSATVDGDILSLFGYLGGNLLYQQKPFVVQSLVHQPDGSDPSVTTYWDCWFETNPLEYDVSNAESTIIVQRAVVTVGRVTVSVSAERAAAAAARSILPSSIGIGI